MIAQISDAKGKAYVQRMTKYEYVLVVQMYLKREVFRGGAAK